MRIRLGLLVIVMVLSLAPAPARADGFLVPFIGYDFGGDAGSCVSLTNCSQKKTSFGVTSGYMSAGIVGFEEDISYAPNFFGKSVEFGDNSVLTAMTNLIVGIPAGPVRPYASGGVGLIRTKINLGPSSLLSFNNTSFGYDIGGGVMAFFGNVIGVRGDLRHIRSATDLKILGFSIPDTKLNFSRASVGLVIRFR